jgi:osmotically-inducible protein OsmY
MRILVRSLFLISLALGLTGCASRSSGTHDPTLLDDKVTAQRVAAALRSGGPDFKEIKVQIRNGETILSGKASSLETRQRAEELVKDLPRVNRLRDDIQVSQ